MTPFTDNVPTSSILYSLYGETIGLSSSKYASTSACVIGSDGTASYEKSPSRSNKAQRYFGSCFLRVVRDRPDAAGLLGMLDWLPMKRPCTRRHAEYRAKDTIFNRGLSSENQEFLNPCFPISIEPPAGPPPWFVPPAEALPLLLVDLAPAPGF